MFVRVLFILLFLMLLVSKALAQVDTLDLPKDTFEFVENQGDGDVVHIEDFRPTQLILPSALITVGAVGVKNNWMLEVKDTWRTKMADVRGENYCGIDDYAQYLPLAMSLGCGFFDKRTKYSFGDRVLTASTATLVLLNIVVPIKNLVEEKRPNSGTKDAFPSGHTATAFMGAELVRSEYPAGYGIVAYTMATAVAFMRTYNDRHWLNDVVAGAGIGILSARIAHWLLPLEKKLLNFSKSGKISNQTVLLPTYDAKTKSFGAVCNISL